MSLPSVEMSLKQMCTVCYFAPKYEQFLVLYSDGRPVFRVVYAPPPLIYPKRKTIRVFIRSHTKQKGVILARGSGRKILLDEGLTGSSQTPMAGRMLVSFRAS